MLYQHHPHTEYGAPTPDGILRRTSTLLHPRAVSLCVVDIVDAVVFIRLRLLFSLRPCSVLLVVWSVFPGREKCAHSHGHGLTDEWMLLIVLFGIEWRLAVSVPLLLLAAVALLERDVTPACCMPFIFRSVADGNIRCCGYRS